MLKIQLATTQGCKLNASLSRFPDIPRKKLEEMKAEFEPLTKLMKEAVGSGMHGLLCSADEHSLVG